MEGGQPARIDVPEPKPNDPEGLLTTEEHLKQVKRSISARRGAAMRLAKQPQVEATT